jgi:hypothetical protein
MKNLTAAVFNRNRPWFVLLLPLFFVLHGFVENYGFISLRDTSSLLWVYGLFAVVMYALCYVIFRNAIKAGLMAAALLAFLFFVCAIYDFFKLKTGIRFLYKYTFLLPFFGCLLLAVFIVLKRSKKPLLRWTLFLNTLFLIFIAFDAVSLAWKMISPATTKMSNYKFARTQPYKIPDTCKKPDIYLLLFDEYSSSDILKERYHFHNDIDSFLTANKFRVLTKSKGNYNYTPFSMSAMLNMKYIDEMDLTKGVNRIDYLTCFGLIRDNEVIKLLGTNGYEIINESIFDLAGSPSHIHQTLLPLKTRMITEGTLLARLYRDFEWIFINYKLLPKALHKDHSFYARTTNTNSLRAVNEISGIKHDKPVFVYGHFEVPHRPVYFNRYGQQNPDTMVGRMENEAKPEYYLENVLYANLEIRKLVRSIMKNTDSSAVIIVASDHGYRYGPIPDHYFRCLNAVYLPNQDYSRFYDSMSNVNEFRVLFNSLFSQRFPLLKDSTYYLMDKR